MVAQGLRGIDFFGGLRQTHFEAAKRQLAGHHLGYLTGGATHALIPHTGCLACSARFMISMQYKYATQEQPTFIIKSEPEATESQ
jgi:hypothetical protein